MTVAKPGVAMAIIGLGILEEGEITNWVSIIVLSAINKLSRHIQQKSTRYVAVVKESLKWASK